MAVQIALPFSFTSSGAINVATSDEKIWSDRVLAALLTSIKERVMFVEYGSNIPATIFETETEASAVVQKETPSLFSRWLPDLTLINASATIESRELADATLVISVEYLLPNKQKGLTKTAINLGTFTQTGLLIQEIQ